MPSHIDQTGFQLDLPETPKRIISLVPSQSEFLWDIGLKNELVGITKFCIHPDEMFRTVTRVGGTKKFDLEKIRSLKPDLIIGNKEENEKNDIDALRKDFPVWMSDIIKLTDSYDMMRSLGKLMGREKLSEELVQKIEQSLSGVKDLFKGKKVAYFIWKNPYMAAANGTFINSLLEYVGFINVFQKQKRYPELTLEELKALQPQLIFLSSEPYPFKEKDIQEIQKVLPDSKVMIVDGEMFSWYGSRLLRTAEYLREIKIN